VRSEVQVFPGPPIFASCEVDRNEIGAIAQLGERLLCKQEVVGSIPSGSTKFGVEPTGIVRPRRPIPHTSSIDEVCVLSDIVKRRS
jgi:hypothetical protein